METEQDKETYKQKKDLKAILNQVKKSESGSDISLSEEEIQDSTTVPPHIPE